MRFSRFVLVALIVPSALLAQTGAIQNIRPNDQRGVDVFETPKTPAAPVDQVNLQFGAAFVQDFQGLSHTNTAAPKVVNGVNQNQLISLGHGFNNAVANLYMNAQLLPGIRVAMTSYLSARHHQETWVKDGYLQIDASPIKFAPAEALMRYTTIKAGHFEINYGDQHFRRTDNGNGIYNPFVGNLILDAFTTEIGTEVDVRKDGVLLMGGVTSGEVHGQVTPAGNRSESWLGKVGVDRQLTPNLRVRLTGSTYVNNKSASNTLYTGDRGGAKYYDVLENTTSTETSSAWSGNLRNGLAFSHNVRAYVVNPFVRFGGLEYFGNFETASGRAASESANRTVRQISNELVYRFVDDQFYVGGRYNTVAGELQGFTKDIGIARRQLSAGWFLSKNILTKVEYVDQRYTDFPSTDIRNGGRFHGYMIEGSVAF